MYVECINLEISPQPCEEGADFLTPLDRRGNGGLETLSHSHLTSHKAGVPTPWAMDGCWSVIREEEVSEQSFICIYNCSASLSLLPELRLLSDQHRHNKCNALELYRNIPPRDPWSVEKLSSTKSVPDAKKVGDHVIRGRVHVLYPTLVLHLRSRYLQATSVMPIPKSPRPGSFWVTPAPDLTSRKHDPCGIVSCLVMPDSLWSHGLQHARLPCPSPSPGACLNACPLSR